MIFRLLILLSILVSTSCAVESRDVEVLYADDSQQSLWNDGCSSEVQNQGFSWFGLVENEDAPVLRNVVRMQSVHRVYEKRKIFASGSLSVSLITIPLKHLAKERLKVCHLNHHGGQLLYFLCTLRN